MRMDVFVAINAGFWDGLVCGPGVGVYLVQHLYSTEKTYSHLFRESLSSSGRSELCFPSPTLVPRSVVILSANANSQARMMM